MNRTLGLALTSILGLAVTISLTAGGCGSSSGDTAATGPGGNGTGAGTTTTTQGGGSSVGGNTGGAGGTTSSSGTGGIAPPTEQVQCGNKLYQCGDLIDNDNDGLIDSQDPDCLGPCDNTEDSYYPNLPGATGQNCDLDCFWDTGQGHDEGCYWDHQCDPYSDLANNAVANPQVECAWDSSTQGPVGDEMFPPSPLTCDEAYASQPQECIDSCLPFAPNGCDCFGCCELDGQYVWIGSHLEGENTGTCEQSDVGTPDFLTDCHPCTPVPGCSNPCDHCEICIGKPVLPPDCFGGEGGGGAGGSGGSPPQDCPEGQQACGLPGQDPCPSGSYCITGCCVLVPG